MMKLVIDIHCDNAAFDETDRNNEIKRILLRIIQEMPQPQIPTILRDGNGNQCGTAKWQEG